MENKAKLRVLKNDIFKPTASRELLLTKFNIMLKWNSLGKNSIQSP